MTEEFNLSEKRRQVIDNDNEILRLVYSEEDVKEFIRRLKDELNSQEYEDYEYPAYQQFFRPENEIEKIIDKLAGEKLK